MKNNVLSLFTTVLVLVGSSLLGCKDGASDSALSDQEIHLFDQKLVEVDSFQGACEEMELLCRNTGLGCPASEVFCNVPTREYVCQQLASTCASYASACAVYGDRCDDTLLPRRDADVVRIDSGVPTADTGVPEHDGAVAETDSGVPRVDTGVPAVDGAVDPDALNCVGLMICTEDCENESCVDECVAKATNASAIALFDAAFQCVEHASNGACSNDCSGDGMLSCDTCLSNACESETTACARDNPTSGSSG